jgi:2-amino-4-hydroxy-6-hydroxymethyldihydropteridine diphosphokinase
MDRDGGTVVYHLGIGSNLDDPVLRLAQARRWIARSIGEIRKTSSVYLTEPVGIRRQPWFLNQVIEIESALSPFEMLKTVQRIERKMKREPGPRNGPRRIDIDILLAGQTVLRKALLTVPHVRLTERKFVLTPLAEIAARKRHPVLGLTIAALRRACPDRSIVIRLPRVRGIPIVSFGRFRKIRRRRDRP